MKTITLIFFAVLLLISCSEEVNYNTENYSHLIDLKNPPVLTFEDPIYKFGEIIEGDIITHKFNFTNTGKGVMVISSVSTSCGCTVPRNWPKGPIKPGEGGYIEVIFNSKNKVGVNNKIITISSNTKPSITKIALQGTVVGPK